MSDDTHAGKLTFRDVEAQDETAVRELVAAAFPSDMEARLVEKLRHCGALVLEQIAENADGKMLGHIAYSRVTPAAIGPGQGLQVACLAPVSVWPEEQRQGIGSALITASLAGFGRGIGEVGAIMIVGGNIDNATRVLTTAIALETGKGDFALALGLGFVLIALAIAVNLAIHTIGKTESEGKW